MEQPPHSKSDAAAWRPSRARLLIVGVLAVAGVTAFLVLWTPSWTVSPPAAARAAPSAPAALTPPAARTLAAAAVRDPEGDADPTPDLRSYLARGENPTMREVIERLHQRGIYTGLGAFSPPGTSPPLVGLAVPEDFVLPKGYVRHHQSTDDGQPIEAILMFAPDFQLYDANNHPIPMPDNRVVPPELAPPGLPRRQVVIPGPAAPGNR
ncbi:MAG TPA: hypothetical protein VFT05_10555 [Burkholderiaceae bacterium]|nr:hypothetical protein [Burkholderiaceae bacterium]